MKKLFAVMLAVMLLLSCMVIAPAAEEENGLFVTDCSTLEGWEGEGAQGIPEPTLDETLADHPVVSFTYTGTVHSNGGWQKPADATGVKIHYKVFKTATPTYDLTGMNYMIFDWYISDPAKIEGVKFYIEMTSMKGADKEERNWKKTLEELKGEPIEAGWNHFEIALDSKSADSGFRPEDWNFLRIHNSDGFEAGEDGITFAFKDICFSETSAKAEAAAAAAQALVDLYAPIAEIGTGDITADNYETIKAQLAAALEAFNAADMATQTAAEETLSATYDVDASKIERNVTRALEKYEESLNTPDEPDAPTTDPDPDQPTDDPATETPDAPTTDAPTTDAPTTDAPATDGDDKTDDATDPEEKDDGMTIYLIIGGIAVLAVIVVVVIVVVKKKK